MELDYKSRSTSTTTTTEPLDAFTRHLDKKFKRRGVQMFSDGRHTGRHRKTRSTTSSPTRRSTPSSCPAAWTCCSVARFPTASTRVADEGRAPRRTPEYQNRDARISVMDRRISKPCSCCRHSPAGSRRRSNTISRRRWPRSTPSTSGWTRTGVSTGPTTGSSPPPIISLADPDSAVAGRLRVVAGAKDRAGPAGPGAGCRQAPLARRSAARSGMGATGRGRRAGRLPPQ